MLNPWIQRGQVARQAQGGMHGSFWEGERLYRWTGDGNRRDQVGLGVGEKDSWNWGHFRAMWKPSAVETPRNKEDPSEDS